MSSDSRLLSMLSLLGSGGSFTAPDLAERFAVTPRTIRRDIAALRDLGYVIEAAPGIDGGYRASHRTLLPPLQFDTGEALATAVGLSLLRGAGLDTPMARTAARKLHDMLPAETRTTVSRIGKAVTVVPGHEPDVDQAQVFAIASAIVGQVRLTFRYAKPDRPGDTAVVPSSGRSEVRRVEPMKTVVFGSHWYLHAWDCERTDWRVFRLDRMSEVHVTTFRFTPRPGRDAEAAVRSAVTVSPYAHTVVLHLGASSEEARAWFPTRTATITEVDDGVRVELGVDDLAVAATYTVGLPVPCRIIAPRQLLAEVEKLRARIDAIRAASR